jgi:hypothetical protein
MAKVNDRVMTDDMDRKTSKVDGDRRIDLDDVVAGRISGPEIIDDVVPGWLLEDECVPACAIHDVVRRR